MLSPEMEDYLKTIYEHQRETEGPVSTSAIAESMDVTPPTATSMMEKLEDRGFVEREKYKGVRLSDEGQTIAIEVIRHHRLLETYLTEKLGFDWAEVHDEADRLEHHISEEFERRVAAKLGEPDVDPHGDPIPSDALEPVNEAAGTVLSECEEGDVVEVNRVRDRDPDELEYLDKVGIVPGTTLTVVEIAPIGMVEIELDDGSTVSLPEHVAATIRVVGSS
ncbi:metal-dependent transcriptional regulator [Halapricum salinum]|uniref:Metal-dependent transcriptional regulator n=1 Tax=Halapricum salinum TaxID=1457250 RepID=A0A4D6HFN8_9EURY|nr:metal-dependent transcriptional regulator [Halapricum salinum]QCC52371.1 metal-dependent transcriptional regulator [Halapricum salinum]